jgi:UDP-GlcNAc:undecaprenyl-phosphate GlcNAc-1-phosphate transferase
MVLLIIAFFVSVTLTGFVIRYQHLHNHVSGDSNFESPQRFRTTITPRISGVAIVMGIAIAILYQ